MSSALPRPLLEIRYEKAAQEYLRNLPLEHFMEATAQATQREITLESLALVRARRRDLHVFNELLVQYALPRSRRLGQVVPDNMAVLSDQPIQADSSFNVPLQPAGPFWVLEYVSKSTARKDYEDSFQKYERELKVPYHLIFYPDIQELTLYRHRGKKYVTVKPNGNGRCSIPELELEVALLGGWVRFWHQGELLPLPADFQARLDEEKRRADAEKRRADTAEQRADAEKRRADTAEQRADAEKRRADELQRLAEDMGRRLNTVEQEMARLRDRIG